MATDHRVYLHIGAPKTGTTYLQAVLAQNRAALAQHGLLYPDSKADAHHKAVWDLRGTPDQRADTKGIEGSWQALADEVNAADSDVLLSSEHFVFALKPQIQAAVSSFDGEVHVIYTARDLVRQVPAVWQERIKNAKSMSYRSFIEAVMSEGGPGAKSFWGAQDAARVLERWSAALDPSRMHLVTAPPPGAAHTVLWERFAGVLGLSGADFDTAVDGSANASLSMAQTELLRRYNERHAEGVPWPRYRRIMRRQLDVLAAIDDGRKISLTPAEHAYFTKRARETTDRLAAAGYDVAGDLDDLVPAAQPAPSGRPDGQDPTELSEGELLAASLDVMHEMLTRQADERRPRKNRPQR